MSCPSFASSAPTHRLGALLGLAMLAACAAPRGPALRPVPTQTSPSDEALAAPLLSAPPFDAGSFAPIRGAYAEALARARVADGDRSVAQTVRQAGLLNNLWLLDEAHGDSQQGLAHYAEVIELLESLEKADLAGHEAALARILVNGGRINARAGRPVDAVPFFESSVRLQRSAPVDPNGEHALRLSVTLIELAGALSGAGRGDEANEPRREGVAALRKLATTDLGSHTFEAAVALLEAGTLATTAGDPAEALTAFEEGVALARRAPPGPDRSANLVAGLLHLASAAEARSQRERAVAALREAVSVARPLAATDPEKYRLHAAVTYGRLALLLHEQGELDEAVTWSAEAVANLRELALKQPQREAILGFFAIRAAQAYARHGEGTRAEEAYREAFEAFVSVGRKDPAAGELGQVFAAIPLAQLFVTAGRLEEARATYDQVLPVMRSWVATHGEKTLHLDLSDATLDGALEVENPRLELARVLEDLGQLLVRLEAWAPARRAFSEAVSLLEDATTVQPAERTARLERLRDAMKRCALPRGLGPRRASGAPRHDAGGSAP